MNTYQFLTICICMNLLIGVILAFDTSEERSLNQLQEKIKTEYDIGTTIADSLGDTSHTLEDYNSDKRAGNEMTISFQLSDVFKYGFAQWIFVKPQTKIEWLFFTATSLLNSLVGIITGLLIFDKWKNRKVD